MSALLVMLLTPAVLIKLLILLALLACVLTYVARLDTH